MTIRWNGHEVAFVPATTASIPEVLAVLDEVAAWLREIGIRQWPARFRAELVEPAIRNGETWLVTVDGRTAATVTLDWSDPVWDGFGGRAGYLHRMAVRRWAAGLGAVILDWAADSTRARGGVALRLDCVAANPRLRAYYEAAGFGYRGDAEVGGAPGQRLRGGPVTMVSRYERPIDIE
jgi:hypothetical protein